MVVDAWLEARQVDSALPKLVVGGAIGPLAADVARRAAEHDLDVTLTGRLSDADLAERYRQAAAVVQPSSDEGFGLQPLEAMASGAPVVVTRTAAVADVVGDCAVVCEPTAKALGSGILDALELSARLRIEARTRAQGFSWDDSARAVLHALATAATSRASA
jgi:glycosyltransferase involved in cell wall biosynthesis